MAKFSTTPTASPGRIEQIFKVLGDPTRRRVVERLGHAPASTSELAAEFDMAMPSFLQHLKALETCGVIASTKSGRVRTYRLTPGPLEEASAWLAQQRGQWERRLDQLDEHLVAMRDAPDDQANSAPDTEINEVAR